MNKKLSVLFIFMLLFQSMSGGFAFATEPKDTSDEDIFTDIRMTDHEGSPISGDDSSDIVNVHIRWTLEDTYTLSLQTNWWLGKISKATSTMRTRHMGPIQCLKTAC